MNERPHFLSVSLSERVHFADRLALFLRSGVPILQALALLRDDARTRSSGYITSELARSVADGKTLAVSLSDFRPQFGEFTIAVIEIGEASGKLEESLSHIAESLKRREELRQRVIGALIYPAIIVVATLAIVLFLIAFVFPKIVPIFKGFGAALPFSTRILISITDIAERFWIPILILIVILSIGAVWLSKHPRLIPLRDRISIGIPLIGALLRSYYLAIIARTLGMLLKSGIGILPSLDLTARAASNSVYRASLVRIRQEVLSGSRLTAAIVHESRLYPTLFSQMVSAGERTGNLSESLAVVAETYEREVDERSRMLGTLIEPALMIITGIIVGFIALAVITPVYQITQDITAR